MVGRTAETLAFGHALDALQRGSGAVVLLAGEPGIGKSTLAQCAAEAAAARDLSVHWGFAWEAGSAPAYWPWTQALRALIAEVAPDAALLTQLADILPEYVNEQSAPSLQPEHARFQLLEAVRQLLASSSADHPRVLILEDLHAADSDSLHLLHYIARHIGPLRLLLIATYRDSEARLSSDNAALFQTERHATVLRPKRLDESQVREYLTSRDAGDLASSSVQQLLQTTAGNPLFLSELVQLLQHGEYELGGRLPETVQQVIGQQLELLPSGTAALLRTAAVIGREFSAGVIGELTATSLAEIEHVLLPAIERGVIAPTSGDSLRFSHLLYRDVLYQSTPAGDRSTTHLRYADMMMQLIDAGDVDRWKERAGHLAAAGVEHREAAVEAWRSAGHRAIVRLAFADAASAFVEALDTFGEGPSAKPRDRCALLLEAALASINAGDIAAGQQFCRTAFVIARTLADAPLMSQVALTYGNEVTVASLDQELIDYLRECLDALPDDEVAMRARVQARLAAAMQPAKQASVPMAMAREAIQLARTTNDERVLLEVLRHAVSALMDFAPSAERIPLNREFEALAEKHGDVPAQFRSTLRLMVDAIETGDSYLLDLTASRCEQLAKRIDLPHYLWRACSVRAMLATFEGRFAEATRLLDDAESLAASASQVEALLTLPLQRFAIMLDWDSADATDVAALQESLENAYAKGLAEAEFYIKPLLTAFTTRDPAVAKAVLANTEIVTRAFDGGDRFSICVIGRIAAIADDMPLLNDVIEALRPHRDGCAMLGLMGMCWSGPVAWTLGELSLKLGNSKEAQEYLEEALEIALAMSARPCEARIRAQLATLPNADATHAKVAASLFEQLELRPHRTLGAAGEAQTARRPVQPPGNELQLQVEGEVWKISYRGESALIQPSKGMAMLATLIATPEQDVHVLDLVDAPAADSGDAGPLLDDKARDEYRRRVAELQEALADAEALGDAGGADAVRGELDFITKELSRAFGLGGRQRTAGNAAERARVNVRRRIKDAIERVTAQLPDAGNYLEKTIKTGTYCRYSPM